MRADLKCCGLVVWCALEVRSERLREGEMVRMERESIDVSKWSNGRVPSILAPVDGGV